MKPALKTALTLVAAFALLLGQGGFVHAAATALPAKKAGCCGDVCPPRCCLEESGSAPVDSLPAIPVNPVNQQLQAAVVTDLFVCFSREAFSSPLPVRAICLAPVGPPVPLYVRTHSFLI